MRQRLRNSQLVISLLFLTLLTAMSSCKKYLDVKQVSSFGPEYVFSNPINAEKAVLGAYEPLAGDAGYGSNLSIFYPFDNDLIMGAAGTPYPDNERRDMAHYSLTATNLKLNPTYLQLFQGVERANLAIHYIPLMAQYENGTSSEQAQLRRLYGEALTLRAEYYLELIRNWGDVPAHFQPASFETNVTPARSDRDSIYDHLLDDLAEAETLVPWRSEVPSHERISQGAVRALRARIALYRGGYSLRQNGSMERGSNYKEYYQIARDECEAIIESGQHQLNPSYESVFKDYIDGLQNVDPYGEIIWSVAMGNKSSATGSKVGYFNGPRLNKKGLSAPTILPTYFYSFDSSDTRRDVTCAPYYLVTSPTSGGIVKEGQNLAKMVDGKYRRDWIKNGLSDPGAQYLDVNWPLFRYSDVLLMFAEADNELNQAPSASAKNALEQVRLRAFNNDAGKVGALPSDYAGFFDAIVQERAFEFGDEAIRKWDLIRWNLLADRLEETKTKLTAMSERQPPYDQLPEYMFYLTDSPEMIWANSFYKPNNTTSAPTGFSRVEWVRSSIGSNIGKYYAEGFNPGKSQLFPIPQQVLDANPNLTQNPGY